MASLSASGSTYCGEALGAARDQRRARPLSWGAGVGSIGPTQVRSQVVTAQASHSARAGMGTPDPVVGAGSLSSCHACLR